MLENSTAGLSHPCAPFSRHALDANARDAVVEDKDF